MSEAELRAALRAGIQAAEAPGQMVDRILQANKDAGGTPLGRVHVDMIPLPAGVWRVCAAGHDIQDDGL